MYDIGDLILYGRTGVCRVESIDEVQAANSAEVQLYYSLRPLYQNCNITTPAENAKVFSRPIISKNDAEKLIKRIPTLSAEPYHNRNLNQLREHYKSCIDSHSCEDLVLMTMSLYAKRREVEQQKRKFGAVDEKFMHEAEELLFGEFAAALGIDKEDVQKYIYDNISGKHS